MYDGDDWIINSYKRFFFNASFRVLRCMLVDRFDPERGYEPENIVKSCWLCYVFKGSIFSGEQMTRIMPEAIKALICKISKTTSDS